MDNPPVALRRNGYFSALVMSPDTLEGVCLDYLHTAHVPTFIGLCATLGTTPQKVQEMFKVQDGPECRPDALAILSSTLVNIEASMVSAGLIEAYNASMTKFMLSAYHNRNEKHISENQSDTTYRIIVETRQPTSLEELEEFKRLEDAIETQARHERIAMGKEEPKSLRGPSGDVIDVGTPEAEMMKAVDEQEFLI